MSKLIKLPEPEDALPGRELAISISGKHTLHGCSMLPPFPADCKAIVFGMGCFWGAERKFWGLDGVYSTAVGYAAGLTENPSYQEVCSGLTGHNEVVLVIYRPEQISLQQLLKVFWESHNPTQGMRQGNDVGTQYRSGIYYYDQQQRQLAEASLVSFQAALKTRGFGETTTEIKALDGFYYAEEYHQQYLIKNENGYCGLGGTGVLCE